MHEWLSLLGQGHKEWRESRGERYSYSLAKVVKNDMPCLRLETLLREYNGRPKPNQGNFDPRPSSKILSQIPRVLASKTGTTDLAGGNLAIIFKPNPTKTVVAVVLGSTPAGRFSDMLKLTKDTISQLKVKEL